MEYPEDLKALQTLEDDHRAFMEKYQTALETLGDDMDKSFYIETIESLLSKVKFNQQKIRLVLRRNITNAKRSWLKDYITKIDAFIKELEDSIKKFQGSDEA